MFGVAVEAGAQSYFPAIFARGGYAIVGIRRLPAALPANYLQWRDEHGRAETRQVTANRRPFTRPTG